MITAALTTHAGGVTICDGGDLEIYNGTAIIGEPGALPQIKLWLKQGVTGSTTAYGIANDTLIENDVTSDFRSYWSNRYSVAGSFNVANVVHFGANESAFPAGVTVGREIGFHATSTIRNATKNYGFFSELPNGSDTFNFYAAGDAPNYFGGNVLIGSTENLTLDNSDGESGLTIFSTAQKGRIIQTYANGNASSCNQYINRIGNVNATIIAFGYGTTLGAGID